VNLAKIAERTALDALAAAHDDDTPAARGARPYRDGRPVIWIHGAPYEAPDMEVP